MPRAQDEYQLHRLCREGGLEKLYNFLEDNGNKHINTFDKNGYTPIHYAVKRDTGDIEHVLSVLFTNDADINMRSLKDGDTALHMVTKRFDEENATCLCLKLLSHGADPDYRNDSYRTVFDIAMAREMLQLSEYLTSNLSLEDAQIELDNYRKKHYGIKLINYVMDGKEEGILSCLKEGADPDTINQHGAASIHYTITHCTLDKLFVLDQLLNAGANVNLQDYELDTALNLVIKTSASMRRQLTESLVIKLLDWGADPRIKDADGKHCFHLAKEMGYTDIISLMRNHSTKTRKRPSDRAHHHDIDNNEDYYDEESHVDDNAADNDDDKKKKGFCVIL